jgi:hypothetical protein
MENLGGSDAYLKHIDSLRKGGGLRSKIKVKQLASQEQSMESPMKSNKSRKVKPPKMF